MSNKHGILGSGWFQIFIGGVILFIATEQALKLTGTPNLIPTVLLLGAFIVPITFVAYFYGKERSIDIEIHREQSPGITASLCFLVGGILGVAAAATVEYATLSSISFLSLLGVGFIEEAAKLIFPVVIFLRGKFRSEADGLLFGVACGMGFAALETMGYGLSALIASRGDIAIFEQVLFIRGLLAPAGHAAWTGFVCAVIWRERNRTGRSTLNASAFGAFFLAVILHSLWDTINSLSGPSFGQFLLVLFGNLVVASVSLTLLFRRLHESYRFRLDKK
jgi:protease PrsW